MLALFWSGFWPNSWSDLAAVAALVATVFLAWRYLQEKWAERRELQFKEYHRLIVELLEGGGGGRLHHQVAIVYELARYDAYHQVTKRILEDLVISWSVENLLKDDKTKTLTPGDLEIARRGRELLLSEMRNTISRIQA